MGYQGAGGVPSSPANNGLSGNLKKHLLEKFNNGFELTEYELKVIGKI